jgi:hypothetical protein
MATDKKPEEDHAMDDLIRQWQADDERMRVASVEPEPIETKTEATNANVERVLAEREALRRLRPSETPTWQKWVLGTIMVLGVFSFIALAFMEDDKPKKPAQSQPQPRQGQQEQSATLPTIRLGAGDLIAAYETNEIAADQRYKHRTLLVTGTISRIGKDILNQMYVSLQSSEDDDGFVKVQCFFDQSAASTLAALRPGQQVCVRGRCDGKFGMILLKQCSLK